jgi:putative pyoverdin transport system ATP-binding/permease protein
MNLFTFLLRSSWSIVSIATIAGSISGFASAAAIASIDRALTNSNSLDRLFYSFLGLAAISIITQFFSQFILSALAYDAIYRLRMQLSRWILASPLRHVEELGINRILATLTEDTNTIAETVGVIPFICIDTAVIVGCFIYLASLSLPVFFITLAFITTMTIVVQLAIGKADKLLALARQQQDELFKHFRSITDGFKELKLNSLRRQAFLTGELEQSAAASRYFDIASIKLFSISFSIGQLLFFSLLGFLTFALPKLQNVEPKIIAGYILVAIYLFDPFQRIMEFLPGLRRGAISLKKIEELGLSLASRNENDVETRTIAEFQDSIKFINISYSYQQQDTENNFTLEDINLEIKRGESIFIIGGNGSGKSTLAKLITGLYIPDRGEISIDGVSIDDRNREAYRQLFSTVFTDFYLFESFLGIDPQTVKTKGEKYLKLLQLEDKVKLIFQSKNVLAKSANMQQLSPPPPIEDRSNPPPPRGKRPPHPPQTMSLSTIELSQGQRKRLALLTAYLEDRSIYIFDEWAADQDPDFREIFYQQLLPELKAKGKTIITITHDDRYFHLGDRIYKLDCGKLIQSLH